MAKRPTNHREQWTGQDLQRLRHLAAGNTPTRLIAHQLGRTAAAITAKAHEQRVSLQPWNQSPYGPRRTR